MVKNSSEFFAFVPFNEVMVSVRYWTEHAKTDRQKKKVSGDLFLRVALFCITSG